MCVYVLNSLFCLHFCFVTSSAFVYFINLYEYAVTIFSVYFLIFNLFLPVAGLLANLLFGCNYQVNFLYINYNYFQTGCCTLAFMLI